MKKKDILKKYKRQKLISNTFVVIFSLMLAIWLNIFFVDNSLSRTLKTNILESSPKKEIWDIYINETKDESFQIMIWKDMSKIKSLSYSFIYNWDNIEIKNIKWEDNTDINIISNTPWVQNIIINFKENLDLKAWDKIVSFEIIKKEEKTENINLINASFVDWLWDSYELSTSGFVF